MKFGKILLVQPMHEKIKKVERKSISFPWGLAFLATYYQKAGYGVEILDGQALQLSKEELVPKISEYDFDIIGISAFSTQYPAVRLIAAHVKKERKVPVVVGGPLPTYQASMTLSSTDVDVCVIGDGELSGVAVLDHFDDLEEVPGIAFKKNGKVIITPNTGPQVDLDDLPMPDFSLFAMDSYLRQRVAYSLNDDSGKKTLIIPTSRGCPYSCHFCSKSSRNYRRMSPKKVCQMIETVRSDFNLEDISFADELFLSSKSWFSEVAPFLKSTGLFWGGRHE